MCNEYVLVLWAQWLNKFNLYILFIITKTIVYYLINCIYTYDLSLVYCLEKNILLTIKGIKLALQIVFLNSIIYKTFMIYETKLT